MSHKIQKQRADAKRRTVEDEEETESDEGAVYCQCTRPNDNDRGWCMSCGQWINYKEQS